MSRFVSLKDNCLAIRDTELGINYHLSCRQEVKELLTAFSTYETEIKVLKAMLPEPIIPEFNLARADGYISAENYDEYITEDYLTNEEN